MAMTPAMESIFANAQQNAASLIETATLAINAKVNTIEEAEAMIQELSSEAVKFNELLTCIMNAMRQVESGDMQKEEAAGIIAPAVKELKDKCTALKIANVEAPGDDITEDEIATLRELIIGAKAAAEDRLVAIRLCDDCKVDPEVENELNPPEENGEAFEFDPADEGFISNFMEKRHKAKVDKAKITVMWESFNDKKSEAILNSFGKAASPMLLAGAEGKDLITKFVDTLKESGDPTSDYIIKTVNGVTMGICPKDPEAKTGCLNIIAPVNFGKKKDVDYFFKKEICEAILNPIKESEVTEAFEFDPATEGIASFIQKMRDKKVSKAKVTVLMDSLKDKKSDAIAKKTVDAMKPMLVTGNDGLEVIKNEVSEMQKADGGDASKYEGKLSSFDYVVKTISGVGVGYLPADPSTGTGMAQMLVPTKDRKGNTIAYVLTVRHMCECILNPIKESEVTEAMEAYEEIAEEATILAAQYVNTTECKTAKALYQNAKKLYSMGSKEKALEYMKKAKDLYEKCLKKLLTESGKFERAERVDPIKKHGGTATIRHNVTRTDSLTFAIARSKLENKIDRCTAHILQWTTKAGKETYQQTLDQLKADREQAKAAKKAAKAKNKNTEMEENTMENFNYSEFMFACESLMDELEIDLATSYAMEADGEEAAADDTKAPSKIGAKLRSLFAKLKSAAKRGDKTEAEQINAEIKAEAENLEAAVDEAPEEKKDGLSKAAKVGLAAGAAALVAVTGMTIAGQAMQKKAAKNGTDPKGAAKAIISASNQVVKAITAPGKGIAAAKATSAANKERIAASQTGDKKYNRWAARQTKKAIHSEQRAAFAEKAKGIANNISSHMPKLGKKSDGKVEISTNSMGYEAMEAYDIYEMIMEAYDAAMDGDFQYDDVEFAAQLEAMM